MATVRFSGELKDHILRNANNLFNKRLDAAREATPDNSWGDRIYNMLFGDCQAALAVVPPEFLKYVETLEIAGIGDIGCTLSFTLSARKPWPLRFEHGNQWGIAERYGSSIKLPDTEMWAELKTDVERYKAGIRTIEEKRQAFRAQVSELIDSYSTLAPALKAWPPLWDLIPSHVKDKHREIVVREKKEVQLGIDLTAMTSAVTAIKIGG